MATFTGYGWPGYFGVAVTEPIEWSADLLAGDIDLTTRTATQAGGPYKSDPTDVLTWYGSDFTYTAGGIPQSGTITAVTESVDGVQVYKLEGLSLSVAQAKAWFDAGAFDTANASVYQGGDAINGSPYADFLIGFGGDDLIYGGTGNDYIESGIVDATETAGNDRL